MTGSLVDFVACATPPPEGRTAAMRAVIDTIGVALAGSTEPAGRVVRAVIERDGRGPCVVLGGSERASAPNAALVNGTAAHAHDYDDMCFVSLAHPSAPLVPACLAAAELAGASGRALLDAYVIGFEVEARLGRLMNPRHYEKGWHCTSTIGTIGAAAAAARLLRVDAGQIGHALSIAASEASGLKGNFGSMVKPLHAGLAARNGILAALLAQAGLTANWDAVQGPQGVLAAMDSERGPDDLDSLAADLGRRWEIVETGITVKLYPSCAATHPTLDALLELKRREGFAADAVESVEIGVDTVTPTVLIHARPVDGLQAKFSMPFCAAAALVDGRVDLDTFVDRRIRDHAILDTLGRVTMRVDRTLDPSAPPLTQANIVVRLRDGRVLTAAARGARGYPEHPPSDEELEAKFRSCAARALSEARVDAALAALSAIDRLEDVRALPLG